MVTRAVDRAGVASEFDSMKPLRASCTCECCDRLALPRSQARFIARHVSEDESLRRVDDRSHVREITPFMCNRCDFDRSALVLNGLH